MIVIRIRYSIQPLIINIISNCMASYRKENLWVTPSKRTYDNLPKSAVRGYSNIASRINYSRNKVE